MSDQLKQNALNFHEFPVPGKIQVSPTKPLATQHDLALVYSPGVAAPCLEIEKDPLKTYRYTARGNLVAIIFNGTAVLGPGNIGASTGRPVMEGKGVLFKKFVGIDVSSVEVDELNPDKLIEAVAAFESTFDGTSLEDIKVPECFYIEQKLHERTDIPILHDDQHGAATISTAAILSGLRVMEKNTLNARMVVSGASAAVTACVNLLVALGLQKHNIVVCDSKGVIYQDREPNMAETKAAYAVVDGGKRTLNDMIEGTDIFLGCSGLGVLTQEMMKEVARVPMILALTNLELEILPPPTKEVRPDAIIYTGRFDYPNQVNNVLCFPFIFRGALDVDAMATDEGMKLTAVRAVAELAHAEQSGVVTSTYGDQDLSLGPEHIIPEPFDPRLIVKIAPTVAEAAMESGVATRPITDFGVYIDKLTGFVYKTSLFMKPTFLQTRKMPKRVILSEEEETHVLYTTQELVTLELTKSVPIGRPNVIEMHIQKLGSQIKAGVNSEIVSNESDPCFKEYRTGYLQIMKRRGVTQEQAQQTLTSNPTVADAIMVQRGEADAMTCGTVGDYHERFSVVKNVFSYRDGVHTADAINALLLPNGNAFVADIYVSDEPDAEEPAKITLMAIETTRRFGIEPRAALLLHSNFGPSDCPSLSRIRQALGLVRDRVPDLMVDGEMHGDAVLMEAIRNGRISDSPLKGSANVLMMPSIEAARISYNLLRVSSSGGVTVGPVLMDVAKPAHMSTPIASVRRIVNTVTLAVVET